MMKKLICALMIMVSLLGVCIGGALADGDNLLKNGGFESINASGEPQGWYTSAYRTQEGYTRFEITDEQAHSGSYSAKITNANTNDARYVCSVAVQPETYYRVSGYILVETMEDEGNGANFAIEDVYAFSQRVYDTDGQWQYVEWYGITKEGQTEIDLDVRIGGYGAESQGIAYFDDISVEQVDSVPEGTTVSPLYSVEYTNSATTTEESDTPQKSTLLFVLLAMAFALLATVMGRYLLSGQSGITPKSNWTILIYFFLLILAFAARIVLGASVQGYQVDINCFSAWSIRMADVGPTGFYAADYFCDYPPGYMLLLWPVGWVIHAIGYASSPGIRLIVKAIPILCDIVTAMVLFAYAKKRIPLKAAVFVSLLFALNPAALVNGAAWGQVDTVLGLLLLLTTMTAMERNWRAALPLFVVAALMKPQALLFAPVGGIWLILSLYRVTKEERKQQWKHIGLGAAIAAGCAAVVIVPFSIGQDDPWWLIHLYGDTLSSYNYATLNTANLMYLLGGNWSKLSTGTGDTIAAFFTNLLNGNWPQLSAGDDSTITTLSSMIPSVTGALLLSVGIGTLRLYEGLGTLKTRLLEMKVSLREREGFGDTGRKVMLSLLLLLFGCIFVISAFIRCTFLSYGTTLMVLVYLFAFIFLITQKKADALPFAMALMLIGIYVLGLKVHERYLFTALMLLPLAYVHTRDKRLLWLCVGLSVTTFINTAIVLDNSILYGSSMGHLNQDTYALNMTLSIVNVLLCLYAGVIAYTGLAPQTETVKEEEFTSIRTNICYRTDLLAPRDARLHLGKRDWLIMCLTVVVYSFITFTNLGSTKAPQTAWVATSATEEVVFKLDEQQTFELLYYAGVSYNNFSVSVSDDGENWSDTYPCEMREGLCYRWNYAITSKTDNGGNVTFNNTDKDNILWLTGKYLRVNAETAGLNLWEIILRDQDGEQLPLTLVSHTGAKDVLSAERPPENLIDEQDTLVGEPGWFNGTYFDEIYHARTAYEHLHGIAPYETTHPPLGKLLMAVGISIFGMTPFGWRFAGALIGVLMLPSLYLLAKQITKRRDMAAFAMLLFTFDLMHFTQTRIATIDSFPVFFIILSVLCMIRYLQTDVFAVPGAVTMESKPRVLTKTYLRTLIPLGLSGLFMGLSIASKWIGLYSAVGLAVLFFIGVYRQARTGFVAYDVDINSGELSALQKLRVRWARDITLRRILVTCAFCLLFFIAVPAVIYYLSYIPYLSPTGPVTVKRITSAQIGMYNYHSTPGLGMDHPFYSPWWQWPLILKPMWFAQDKFEPAGWASTIMCMGNPLIFYVGALCMVIVFGLLIRKYVSFRDGLRIKQGDGNLHLLVLAIGFLAQYLPWVLVPRSMYIYHYFASVPFIILATMTVFGLLPDNRWRKRAMIAYIVLAAGFFIMFFPYASGLMTPTWYMDWLKWFPKLYY